MSKNRIYYRIDWVAINGMIISNLQNIDIVTHFNLGQCFCSCSVSMDVHYTDCPNAIGKKIGTVTVKNGKEIKKYYQQQETLIE